MSQLTEQAKQVKARTEAANEALNRLVRSLEPVLRDANAHHMADRLAATIAEVDAANAEATAFLEQHREEIKLQLLTSLFGYK